MKRTYIRHNIKQLPKQRELESIENGSNFSRVIDASRKVKEWKAQADIQKAWLGVKRRSVASALKEFRELYEPSEFFLRWTEGTMYRDDSLEVYYRK